MNTGIVVLIVVIVAAALVWHFVMRNRNAAIETPNNPVDVPVSGGSGGTVENNGANGPHLEPQLTNDR
jgi:hypothetical protein